jgi:gag-polypeptide of LTR copia-type/Domain of unknown function (DUF4219)
MEMKIGFENIEKLGEDNYNVWSVSMKSFLQIENLWYDVIIDTSETPVLSAPRDVLKKKNEGDKKDFKAFQLISSCVDQRNENLIWYLESGREAWEILSAYHQAAEVENRLIVLMKLNKVKIVKGGSMITHLSEMMKLFIKLKNANAEMTEEDKVFKILMSVEEEYSELVNEILSVSYEPLNVREVSARLIMEWKKNEDLQREELFINSEDYEAQPSTTDEDEFEETAPIDDIVYADDVTQFVSFGVESVAVRQATPEREVFEKDDEEHRSKIDVENEVEEIVIEPIKMSTDDGAVEFLELENVPLVPGLRGNLLSVWMLEENEDNLRFDQHRVLPKEDMKRMIAPVKDEKQEDDDHCCMPATNLTSDEEKCVLEWHEIPAHRNFRAIESSSQKLKIGDICEQRLFGKMSGKLSRLKVKKFMDCEDSNVCGPTKTKSIGRNQKFIRGVISYREVQSMHHKSEVKKKFANHLKRRRKVFQIDRGGEQPENNPIPYLKLKAMNDADVEEEQMKFGSNRQEARVRRETRHESLSRLRCKRKESRTCLYSLTSGGDACLLIHADDVCAATTNENDRRTVDEYPMQIRKNFETKYVKDERNRKSSRRRRSLSDISARKEFRR